MAAMFVVALAIPESFADLEGGLFAPFVLAACYAVVRIAHLVCYWLAAGDDSGLRRQLLVTAVPVVPAVALLVVGGAVGPPYQTLFWAGALLVDYSGIWLTGTTGWRVHSAAHFAERHQLIMIVALGESLVAIGVGVAEKAISGWVIVGATLGVALSVSLWWLYFDVVAQVAERALAHSRGDDRVRLARDSYTYLHFPIVISIIYIALGLKKVLEYVADTDHHDLTDALTGAPLVALYGGVAVYLLGHVAFRKRNVGTWNPHRTIAAVLLLALLALAWQLPAIAALGLVTGVLVALVAYELVRFAAARDEVRHAPH
jgi:low temperature requirement protein LtrA